MQTPDIWFYNLNIYINNMPRIAFTIFGLDVFWYGVIIAISVTCGYLVASREARRTGQNPELYSDLLLWVVPAGAIGARIYYILFSQDQGLGDFFSFRGGGLAFYGLIFGALPVTYLFTKIKKMKLGIFVDTAIFGVVIGQIIGRWGNFINREAYGTFTNNIFAMRYRVDQLVYLPHELINTTIFVDGVEYIQVHPTFLYESIFNFFLFLFLNFYKHKKAFNGELLMIYFIGYGTARAILETLRTDSLMWGPLRTSVIVSIFFAIIGIVGITIGRKFSKGRTFRK